MKKLDSTQRNRLVGLINECLSNSSVREVAKSIGCSFGYISEISSGKRKDITEGYALLICKGLNINPFYVFGASKPRYINWHGSFQKL